MTVRESRPRILCIRPGLNDAAGTILTTTSDEWVEALSLHADVDSVEQDFDLASLCRSSRPDLVILDAVNWTRPKVLRIDNAQCHPDIPRILFLNSDPHDPMRPLTFRMAEDLGIETVFITGEAYRQHMPELARYRCHFVPQFINGAMFRDYGLEKTIPISVFGGHLLPDFYPWRARILSEIQHVLPTMIFPHPGYAKGFDPPFAVKGQAYAEMLCRSAFSIADTTRLDYAVRKHIEIPACGAVLVAPASDALASYGFVDMQNCVLGAGPELYGKIAEVAADPALYMRIRSAGMALVSKRYVRTSWRLMLDWLACHQRLQPGQVVQQTDRYGGFQIVSTSSGAAGVMAPVQRDSDMAATLRRARAAILTGTDLDGAEAALRSASEWVGHIAEPHFLLGIFHLLRGMVAEAAVEITRRPQSQEDAWPLHSVFDPVEAAWLLIISRLSGNVPLEQALRQQVESLPHLSVRRALALIDGSLNPNEDAVLRPMTGDVTSVHWLGNEDLPTWLDLVKRVIGGNNPGA